MVWCAESRSHPSPRAAPAQPEFRPVIFVLRKHRKLLNHKGLNIQAFTSSRRSALHHSSPQPLCDLLGEPSL